MNRTFLASLAGSVLALFGSAASAQSYVPATKGIKLDTPESRKGLAAEKMLGFNPGLFSETVLGPDPFTCAVPPRTSELTTKVTSSTLTSQAAAQLSLPMGGLTGKADTYVLVQDWMKSKPCLSNDGKTTLIYGYGFRLVATIANIESAGNLTLATIAAQATLNNKASNVEAVLIGISNANAETEMTKLLGPLTVENFSTKANIAKTVSDIAIAANAGTPEFIGVVQPTTALQTHVASTLGLQGVADGKSCQETRSKVPTASPAQVAAVEGIYISLTTKCTTDKPTPTERAEAKAAMLGFKLR